MKLKYWKIHFSMKKGDYNKFKPQLKYINQYYRPHYLQISQMKWYDIWNTKPVPIIEFIVAGYDALHFMDDFLEKFPKITVTGGAEPYNFMKIPAKLKRSFTKKFLKEIKERNAREKKNAELYRNLYKQRLARDRKKKK